LIFETWLNLTLNFVTSVKRTACKRQGLHNTTYSRQHLVNMSYYQHITVATIITWLLTYYDCL